MTEYVINLTLDINCQKSITRLFMGQYDIGRKAEVTVTADGEPYTCKNCTVVCQGVRGNRTHFAFDCEVNSAGNIIATFDEILKSSGIAFAKFVISDSNHSYSTQNFIIDCDHALLGDITNNDDYITLNQLMEQVIALTATGAVLVDKELSSNSNNPVASKVIYSALCNKQKSQYIIDTITTIEDLISYNDVNAVYNGVMSEFSTIFGQTSDTEYVGFRMWFVQHSPKQAISFDRIILLHDGSIWSASSVNSTAFRQITYSKKQIDTALADKADTAYVNTSLATKADNTEVISISEGKSLFTPYSEFFRGQVGSSGTISRDIKYRVTSEDIMKFDYDLNVSVDDDFTGYLVEYESGVCKNKPPTKSLANYNNIIPAGTEFRLHIRRTNEITSETANINEFVNAVKFQTKTAAGISKVNKDISEISNNLKATDNALTGELPLKWLQGNVPPLGGGAGNRIIAVLGLMTQPFTISWTDENRVVKVWGYDSDTYSNRTKEISAVSGDTIVPTQGMYYVIVTHTEDSAVIKPAYGDNVVVNVTFQKIKELDGRIKTIEDNLAAQFVDKPIPDYYYENDYLPNKIKEIKEACAIKSGVTFAFITDVHFKDNQKKSKYLLQKILNETNIPFAIYGGDTVSVYGTEAELYEQIAEFNDFKKCIGKDRLFCTRGNHDFYNVTSSTDKTMHSLTTADVYDGLFRDTEHLVTSMSVKNGCYCIDNEAQKTRIIMLNTSDLSSDPDHLGGGILFRGSTLQWLADCLLEKKNYKIIIVCHHHINDDFINGKGEKVKYDFANTSLMDLVSSFVNKEDFITEQNGVSVNVDFANTSNELVCVLSGHRHMDLESTKNGILNIVTTGDALYQNDGYGRKAGTISEQAFDIVCVNYDTENKIKIKLIRVGAGENREFEFDINPSAKVPEDEYYTKTEIDSIVSNIANQVLSLLPNGDEVSY